LDLDITCTATAVTLTSGVPPLSSYFLNGATSSYVVTAAVTPVSCSTEYTITMAISSTSTIAQLVGSSATQSIDVFGTNPAELGLQDFTVVATATAIDGFTTLTSDPLGFQVNVLVDCTGTTILNQPAMLTQSYDITSGVASLVADVNVEGIVSDGAAPCDAVEF